MCESGRTTDHLRVGTSHATPLTMPGCGLHQGVTLTILRAVENWKKKEAREHILGTQLDMCESGKTTDHLRVGTSHATPPTIPGWGLHQRVTHARLIVEGLLDD